MFRLLEAGLPKDPVFPADLKGLGYFINDEDEIRSIENPLAYFKYFLSRNDRYNAVQREMMNGIVRQEVLKRLYELGLRIINLPLGARDSEPHVPILVSGNLSSAKRVIILFYEHTQDLGVFAHRVIGGKGGVNEGSAVNFVKYIQSIPANPAGCKDKGSQHSPGIILANLGQLRWWRKGKRVVTQTTWYANPQKSAVTGAPRFDEIKNTVPRNRNTQEHVAYTFNSVVRELVNPEAKMEVMGVTDGAYQVVGFLNRPENWRLFGPRMTALALLAPYHNTLDLTNPDFSAWLEKRGRAYVVSETPATTPLAGCCGSHLTSGTGFGCPTFSLGEPYYSELMLPKGYKIVLDWFQEVVSDEGYENPLFAVYEDIIEDHEKSNDWAEYGKKEVDAEEPHIEETKVELHDIEVGLKEVQFYEANDESVHQDMKTTGSKLKELDINATAGITEIASEAIPTCTMIEHIDNEPEITENRERIATTTKLNAGTKGINPQTLGMKPETVLSAEKSIGGIVVEESKASHALQEEVELEIEAGEEQLGFESKAGNADLNLAAAELNQVNVELAQLGISTLMAECEEAIQDTKSVNANIIKKIKGKNERIDGETEKSKPSHADKDAEKPVAGQEMWYEKFSALKQKLKIEASGAATIAINAEKQLDALIAKMMPYLDRLAANTERSSSYEKSLDVVLEKLSWHNAGQLLDVKTLEELHIEGDGLKADAERIKTETLEIVACIEKFKAEILESLEGTVGASMET